MVKEMEKEVEGWQAYTISLKPSQMELIDRMAKEMNMTRSGFISFMATTLDSIEQNKGLNLLLGKVTQEVMRKIKK